MKCRCGNEARLLAERTIQVPAIHAGKIVRAWSCDQCQAQFHTIEGPLTAGQDLGIIVVDEHDAAEILGKSVYTLRNERSKKQSPVPFVKQGRRVGYLLADLAEYLLANRVMPEGTNGMP